jgi:pyridoxal phosphate enzyme (YggS family)
MMTPTPQLKADTESDLAARYRTVRDEILESERQYGRETGPVTLVAVSKTHPADAVRALSGLGHREFAENKIQEAVEKISQLSDIPDLCWHFIGSIQSNKCRDIAHHFDWVHSVDRIKIARRLSEMRSKEDAPLNVLIQVNLQNEITKSGVDPVALESLAKVVTQFPNIRLRGLMAIPEPEEDFDAQRRIFGSLREMQSRLNSQGFDLDVLSMGMTTDMRAAIAEGATHVRVGTAIFGPRAYPDPSTAS